MESESAVSPPSPLARAPIGKTAGDVVEVSTPSGGKAREIIEVSFVAFGGE